MPILLRGSRGFFGCALAGAQRLGDGGYAFLRSPWIERRAPMGLYAVTIVADTLEAASALRGMGLDLHERAARRRDTGEITVPAVLSDETIQRVRAAGYRVDVEEDLEQVAAARS